MCVTGRAISTTYFWVPNILPCCYCLVIIFLCGEKRPNHASKAYMVRKDIYDGVHTSTVVSRHAPQNNLFRLATSCFKDEIMPTKWVIVWPNCSLAWTIQPHDTKNTIDITINTKKENPNWFAFITLKTGTGPITLLQYWYFLNKLVKSKLLK